MTTDPLHDGGRRWYTLETPGTLHPREGRLVSDVVLDVLGPLVDRVEIDAFTDHADERGEAQRVAEDDLRSVRASAPGRRGDPGMGVELRMAEPTHARLVRTYLSWTIHGQLWGAGVGPDADLGTFHDSSLSITLRLTDAEAAAVADRVRHLGELRLLREVHRERREARRARRHAVWRARWEALSGRG